MAGNRKEVCRKCGRTVEAQYKSIEKPVGFGPARRSTGKPDLWWFECECGHTWETPQGSVGESLG